MMNIRETLKDGREITVRTCTVDDITAILNLQNEVIQSLTTTAFLQPLSKEEFLHILSEDALMIGSFYKGALIGFRALYIPTIDEADHLGEDAGIPKKAWDKVIYSEISNVSPKFRGNGLQKLLGELIIREIDTTRFHYLCATVAPFNIASLLDKFAHGLKIVALKEKYAGVLRYVLRRDFYEEVKDVKNHTFVQMDDIEAQQALLAEGWCGVRIEKKEEQWFVEYRQY